MGILDKFNKFMDSKKGGTVRITEDTAPLAGSVPGPDVTKVKDAGLGTIPNNLKDEELAKKVTPAEIEREKAIEELEKEAEEVE